MRNLLKVRIVGIIAIAATLGSLPGYGNGEQELYDLQADPYELDNLAMSPGQAARLAELSARLDALAR